jgi:hypothetical protein
MDEPESDSSTAEQRLERLVRAWNESSFEAYSGDFTQTLIDHYNPSYFSRIREKSGRWISNQYLGCLKQGRHHVHLWRSRFEVSENDALCSLTLTEGGKIAGLIKRLSGV